MAAPIVGDMPNDDHNNRATPLSGTQLDVPAKRWRIVMFERRKERQQTAALQAQCKRHLQELQGLLEMHRMVPAGDAFGRAIKDSLAESGQLAQAVSASSQRDRTIERLMKTYGDCVRSVQGADPQDLFMLYNLGMISDPLA